MEEKYNYSIIIPHYNIPKLLKRCLSSIPPRNDTQVIVVDDKSSAENIDKLKELEHVFDNVEFIYSEKNGGGGRARNIGLQNAKGDYVLFADADDFFNYCLDEVLDYYQREHHEIVYFNANVIDTDSYLLSNRKTSLKEVIARYEKSGDLSLFRFMFGEPWCKLISRELIVVNHVEFEELPKHNDTKFSYLAGYYAKDVIFDNRALYTMADRVGSVSKGLSDVELQISTRVFAEKNHFLKDHGIGLFDDQMITPFLTNLIRRDSRNFEQCMSIVKKNGYSSYFVIRKLAMMILKSTYRKMKHLLAGGE